jgi:hypothetical protein
LIKREDVALRNIARAVRVWTDEYQTFFELFNPNLAAIEVLEICFTDSKISSHKITILTG